MYALPPNDLSYYLDDKNLQIHSTFEVGEFSTHSNSIVQASSLGITQQQREGLQQQIAEMEAILGATSNTPVSMYYGNPVTLFPTLSSSYVSENASPTTFGAIVQSGISQSFSLISIGGKNSWILDSGATDHLTSSFEHCVLHSVCWKCENKNC